MEATVSLLKSWNAHTDAVLCLQTIQDPPSIITSGYDRLVKVWNYVSHPTTSAVLVVSDNQFHVVLTS